LITLSYPVSQAQADAFLDRVESDQEFANELDSLKDDPPAVLDKLRAEGFDVAPEEVREAFLDRYGAELTPEQLEQIAAGVTDQEGLLLGVVAVGVVAAAAAAI
jgi:predicted ribosomally synthesized peptide with nif11-like leader